jgi:hypothetical protein
MNSSFLQMNFLCFKILVEFSTFFLVQMIFLVAVNTFNERRARDFIIKNFWEDIFWRNIENDLELNMSDWFEEK